jgi:hypothetical protein
VSTGNYQFYVWKYLGYKIVNINGRETTKDKTVCKICVNDVSYMTGNTSNMPTHLMNPTIAFVILCALRELKDNGPFANIVSLTLSWH